MKNKKQKGWEQKGWVVCFREEGAEDQAITPVCNPTDYTHDSFTGYGELFILKKSAKQVAKELNSGLRKKCFFVREAVLMVGGA